MGCHTQQTICILCTRLLFKNAINLNYTNKKLSLPPDLCPPTMGWAKPDQAEEMHLLKMPHFLKSTGKWGPEKPPTPPTELWFAQPDTGTTIIEPYLVLDHGCHFMRQVKQTDQSILGHTFPHERQGVTSPFYIKWGDNLCRRQIIMRPLSCIVMFQVIHLLHCRITSVFYRHFIPNHSGEVLEPIPAVTRQDRNAPWIHHTTQTSYIEIRAHRRPE